MIISDPENERACILDIKNGSFDAFRDIYIQYQPSLFAFIFRYLKNREETEEITQDIFLYLWEYKEKLNENLSFKSYLFTIAKNKITDYFRKQKIVNLHHRYIRNFISMADEPTLKDLVYKDIKTNIAEAVEKLPEKRKMVYIMSKKLELSRQEIARHLHISENTVKNQLQEAMKFLRDLLGDEFVLMLVLLILLLQ